MAMVKPIGVVIPAFDAHFAYTFKFQSIGGNQVVANRLVIKENENDRTVYDNKIESYGYSHTVPADTLTNGKYYYYYFITYDKADDASQPSDSIPFYCYTTPQVTFDNIPSDKYIESSNFNFEFTYNQKEGELLEYIILNLFDATNKIVATSGELYSVGNPPNKFNYIFDGLINNETYSVQVTGRTVNSTIFTNEKVTFQIAYYYSSVFNQLDLSNNCEEGYVAIRNNAVLVEGDTYPMPPTFIDDDYIVLTQHDAYVDWNKGYSFGDTFVLEAWMWPNLPGEVIRLWGDSETGNYLEVKLVREIPYKETEYKDTFELSYYNNDTKEVYKFTEYVELLNNVTKIFLWIKKTKDNVEIKIQVLDRTKNVFVLNETSNIELNRMTDYKLGEIDIPVKGILRWNTVSDLVYNEKTNLYWNVKPQQWTGTEKIVTAKQRKEFFNSYDLRTVTHTRIRNGVYDHVYITKNLDLPYVVEIPAWDYYTILSAGFKGNINAGNVDFLLADIQSVKIKRRKRGDFTWVTLFEISIENYDDLTFIRNDFMCPSGEEFEWAIVPILNGNIEGAYAINSLKTDFNGVFLTDNTGSIKLYNNVSYTENSSNMAIGSLQPYGTRYPKFIYNPTIDYQILGVSGMLCTDEEVKEINRNKLVELQNYVNKFLKNGHPKIFKDWNGRILLCLVSNSPNYTYNASYGMGIPVVTFQLTEQGQYDNQEDLYYNGLIEVIS